MSQRYQKKSLKKIHCPKSLNATLRGDQEEPEVETDAKGVGFFYLSKDHKRLKYSIKVVGLSSELTAAHFHQGGVGVNGPVLRPIEFKRKGSFWVAKGFWNSKDQEDPLNSRAVALLLTGGIYVNVHTEQNAPGEVRGQIFVCDDEDYEKTAKTKLCDSCCRNQRGDMYGWDN